MYKYWCTNEEHKDKPDFYYGETNDLEKCDCGGNLKLLGETTNFFAKIRSMSPAQRQEVLLKRSKQHSLRDGEIKDRRDRLHNENGLLP